MSSTTTDDHFKTLKDFDAAYEGQATTEEKLRLVLNKALHDDPGLESFLETLPWRVFSAKAAQGGNPGVFACYRFPSMCKRGTTQDLGELRWYFLPDGSTEVRDNLRRSVGWYGKGFPFSSCHLQLPWRRANFALPVIGERRCRKTMNARIIFDC